MAAKSPRLFPPVASHEEFTRDSRKDHRYHSADYPEHSVSRALLHLAERADSPARRNAQKQLRLASLAYYRARNPLLRAAPDNSSSQKRICPGAVIRRRSSTRQY